MTKLVDYIKLALIYGIIDEAKLTHITENYKEQELVNELFVIVNDVVKYEHDFKLGSQALLEAGADIDELIDKHGYVETSKMIVKSYRTTNEIFKLGGMSI